MWTDSQCDWLDPGCSRVAARCESFAPSCDCSAVRTRSADAWAWRCARHVRTPSQLIGRGPGAAAPGIQPRTRAAEPASRRPALAITSPPARDVSAAHATVVGELTAARLDRMAGVLDIAL